MQNIHVQARALIIQDEHILLCKTKGLKENFYFLPGGHVNHAESLIDCLKRELKEEIGLDFKIGDFLACSEHYYNQKYQLYKCHKHDYGFIYRAEISQQLTNNIQTIEDHIEIHLLKLSDLDNINYQPARLKNYIFKWAKAEQTEKLISHFEY